MAASSSIIDPEQLQAAQALLLRDLGLARMTQVIPQPVPAAGTEVSITVPGDSRWTVQLVSLRLVTSAVVANRAIVFRFDDPANRLASVGVVQNQIASQTIDYTVFGGPNGRVSDIANGYQFVSFVLPILQPGWRFRTVTSGLDVGDQFSQISITVIDLNEWAINWFTQSMLERLAQVSD